jgi:lipase
VRLHWYEWGDAGSSPVVCLHGVLAHGRRFRKLAEERLAASFRVVALDLRGHGHSDWEPPWDLDAHLADLEETAAALGIDRAIWIGHSFGGRLSMELAARRPDLVDRLVLLDPAIWVPPPIALQRAEAERADRSFSSVEEAIERRLGTGGLHHTPRELLEEEMADHLVASEDGLLRYRYAQSSVVAAYGELAKSPPPFEKLRVPTLLVRGASTDVVPEPFLEVYREGLGDLLEVATVPGGHIVLWDGFAETADAIEDFLADGGPRD